MSKEQIYEMQDDLKNCHTQFVFDFEVHTDYYETASKLVNIGYRKQSEGKWLTKGKLFMEHYCSVCGYSVDYLYQRTPFCPNCGAKMKGGE